MAEGALIRRRRASPKVVEANKVPHFAGPSYVENEYEAWPREAEDVDATLGRCR